MINPNNQAATKIVELFEVEKMFTSEELNLMEDYLCGNVGDEALEKFSFRDMSKVTGSSELQWQCSKILDKGNTDVSVRLGKLLFAIGEASCYGMFPASFFTTGLHENFVLEPEQKTAIYAATIGAGHYVLQIRTRTFKKLMEIAEHKPEVMKEAMGYRMGNAPYGRLVLLVVYFLEKYPDVASGTSVRLDVQDEALMKAYEDILIDFFTGLYQGKLSQQSIDEIRNTALSDKVDHSVLQKTAAVSVADGYALRMVTGAAFANYALSPCLKNIVSLCFATKKDGAFGTIADMDVRNEEEKLCGILDEVFEMDDIGYYLKWLAGKLRVNDLTVLFRRHREAFLTHMDSASFNDYSLMSGIIRKEDPELFQQREGQEIYRQQKILTDSFVQSANTKTNGQVGDEVRKYINGEGGIEIVYAIRGTLSGTYYWAGSCASNLRSYQSAFGSDVFSNRCETLMFATQGCSLYSFFVEKDEISPESVKRTFAAAEAEGLDLASQLGGYAYLVDSGYQDKWIKTLEATAKEIFRGYLEKSRDEMVAAFQNAGSVGRSFGLSVLAEEPDKNKEVILSFSQDTAKAVKESLLDILYGKHGWEEDIVRMLSAKKAGEREIAIKVLDKWKSEAEQADYTQILTQALEKEKNAKMRALLESVLQISVEKSGEKTVSQEELVKELHKGNRKRALAWAYETPFSVVHKKDGTEAGEEFLQAIFLCYSTMSPCGVSPSASSLAEALDEREFAVYVNELFDKWMEAGAESKKRWVLYAAAIHGGEDMVKKLHHQIQEWPQEARGAIASEAVQALALSPSSQGLLIVDGISRKFKFKQVKAAAGKALEFAASQLGITTEELADRIVPNLGFDEKMQRVFDYGERKFTVTITTALEIEVFDENGKKLKNLPAPGKKDDEAKATAAYEEFKQMKKQMKTTVSSQKMRLEMALSTERQWSVQAWKDLFVKNPIMHQFAIGLIWGVYEDRKLVSCFRYMEDGSFNMEDEEEFTLPGDGEGQFIGLVHPIELCQESKAAWKEQLEDYEITQPIEQLDRPVYYRTEEEGKQKTMERFGGVIVNDLSLGGKLTTQGWYRGSVEDAGGFYTYYREDRELSLGAVLYFSGSFVGGQNDDVTVYEVRFFKAGELVTWDYDKEIENKACRLEEIPDRYFSEIVLQVAKATAAGKEKNENWKSTR